MCMTALHINHNQSVSIYTGRCYVIMGGYGKICIEMQMFVFTDTVTCNMQDKMFLFVSTASILVPY